MADILCLGGRYPLRINQNAPRLQGKWSISLDAIDLIFLQYSPHGDFSGEFLRQAQRINALLLASLIAGLAGSIALERAADPAGRAPSPVRIV